MPAWLLIRTFSKTNSRAGARAKRETVVNGKQLVLCLVLAPFLALTAYAVYHYGFLAFFDLHAANAVQLQIFIDLVLALSLVIIWMWQDARARGMSPLPYAVMTIFLGSIGPFIYLIRRGGMKENAGRASGVQ